MITTTEWTPTRKRKPNPNWMNAAEVAEALDISERTVWKWEGMGIIPAAVRRGPKWTRWRRAEVMRFVETGQMPGEE